MKIWSIQEDDRANLQEVKKLEGSINIRLLIDNYKELRNLHDRKELYTVGRGRQLFLIVQLNGRTLRVLIDLGAIGNFIHPKVTTE
jgi:hypothetical protein